MTKTITIINSNSLNNNEVNEQEKDYKTFSVQDQVIISSYHHKNNGK